MPNAIAGLSRQYALSAAEVPLTYPELVSKFRSFLGSVAAKVSGNEGRVFIGVDELDKIGDPNQAQRFINEMKAVLGVPNCSYLVTLSDDALASYELRGLPVRDAFDSAFDEVIHVGYLQLKDSRRLLSRRVIGMSVPFICLCHCLSGGLPRDLIRTARHAVSATRPKDASGHIAEVCGRLVIDELASKLHAAGVRLAGQQLRAADGKFLHDLQRIASGQPGPELRDSLAGLRRPPDAAEAAGDGEGAEAAAPVAVISELWAYLEFLRTLHDVFNGQLSKELIVAASSAASGEGSFDQLCRIRQTLSTSTEQAMLAITAFRSAWTSLPASRRRCVAGTRYRGARAGCRSGYGGHDERARGGNTDRHHAQEWCTSKCRHGSPFLTPAGRRVRGAFFCPAVNSPMTLSYSL